MKKKILFLIIGIFFILGLGVPTVQAYDKGIDVYEYSNISNYNQLKNSGVKVVIQKATEGSNYNDSLLNYRATHLKEAGFTVGYYHFATNNGDAAGQANHFINQIKGLKSDTVYWLDIEQEDRFSKATAIDFVNKFNAVMKSKGYKMGIYTGAYFYYDYLQGNIDSSIPLWIASYGKQPKEFPNQASWQYSESGKVTGVIGNTDMDYFIGDIYLNSQAIPQTVKPQTNYSSAVKTAQYQLNRVMNSKLTLNGILDQKTINALSNFQNMEGITVNGNVSADTQTALHNILDFPICYKGGGNHYAVRYVQYRLGTSIDGVYGKETATHVGDYQLAHKLVSDGICGQNTWKELFK